MSARRSSRRNEPQPSSSSSSSSSKAVPEVVQMIEEAVVGETNSEVLVDKLEHAIWMILMANRYIDDESLKRIIEDVRSDFKSNNDPVENIFENMNRDMKAISFQIKTCVMKDGEGRLTKYHSICNTEEDEISKQFGSSFNPNELKFFTLLALKLIEMKHLTTSEISAFHKKQVEDDKIRVSEYHIANMHSGIIPFHFILIF